MQAGVNVLMNLKDFKLIPFGWEMSNVVLQFFVQLKGNLKLWLYIWLLNVMPKINLVEMKVNLLKQNCVVFVPLPHNTFGQSRYGFGTYT